MGFIYCCSKTTLFPPVRMVPDIFQKTLKFINAEAKSVHGSVRASSVFTSESGEWKLAGFDVLSSMNEDEAVIYVSDSTLFRA